jgi:hypothetical protein
LRCPRARTHSLVIFPFSFLGRKIGWKVWPLCSTTYEFWKNVEFSENKCQLCNLRQGCTNFTKNVGVTSKLYGPDVWQEASFILRTHKYQVPPYKMQLPRHLEFVRPRLKKYTPDWLACQLQLSMKSLGPLMSLANNGL